MPGHSELQGLARQFMDETGDKYERRETRSLTPTDLEKAPSNLAAKNPRIMRYICL
ncbi:hypothetical protein FOPG_19866 [Fusarium oxysporum f. sp. conglutinans race 2 54008]|uniref:Uncharacterized protein n=1 Tax=Fusarium oxysporum f. sp. conglutinans race 2 54008 TaxID=1089457 RepID=X0GVN0_FUSOX|nr:hypothetical protein FOPG_19866 [Fusarium oxysporum f. sp. conglutinans race 2 54008]